MVECAVVALGASVAASIVVVVVTPLFCLRTVIGPIAQKELDRILVVFLRFWSLLP